MNKEIPLEEGDLNTSSIKEGLASEEKINLRKDLEAVESGDVSSESILNGGASESGDGFHRQWHADNEKAEMEEVKIESQAEDFWAFVKEKGLTEVTYDEVYSFLESGSTQAPFVRDANPELEKQLEKLQEEWEAKK